MLDVALVLASTGCWFAGALISAVPRAPERLATGLGLAGSLLALGAALHLLLGGAVSGLDFRVWGFPARLELDALSAAFLLPLHLVGGLGLIYGQRYWPLQLAWGSGRSLRFFYGLLVAAMTLLFLARHGLVFLVAWELMAVSAFFLVGTEHEKPEVRRASWVYLACTHTGTLLLTAMVILLAQRSGGLLWTVLPTATSPWFEGGILLLAVAGFGFKMGVLPLHFWLPSAHASAPSHVSAILSAVMLKTGIYGILRVSSLLPDIPRGVGGMLLALGALTALYGVGNALAQRDYKRLLAYSSIENLGIIAMGVGLGWTGRATHDPWLMALGFGGAVFHVWNHAVFKSLLFYGAGALLHATGTRDMEALGGLARRMPRTALAVFPAVLAVAALPPFNAFLSEWFLYRGLFASLGRGYPWSSALGLVALALVGGMAAVAFARFFGTLFLGSPRSGLADHAHDPAASMLLPMAVLAGLCLAVGLGAFLLLPLLDRVIAAVVPGTPWPPAPLAVGLRVDLRLLAGVELGLLALVGVGLAWLHRQADAPEADLPTWDCGYAAPVARAQYTGSSFADAWAPVQPGLRARRPRFRGLFPAGASFRQAFRDPVGEVFLEPRVVRVAERLLRFRRFQQGHLPVYLLYVLLTLLGTFLWMLLRGRLLG
ncbi:proton-conducting transporter membrane subunit [Geothrix alkalitolerans]|uniref:proton-conducting transporter transmembrane domain-containing protein n=1 Tax=Geothrix alkalitolerans TaxID=2922724 RepID=UPI001FB00FF7|nr:proton-conducting transporter membrane subunit [Geothrix alkalitolerans]